MNLIRTIYRLLIITIAFIINLLLSGCHFVAIDPTENLPLVLTDTSADRIIQGIGITYSVYNDWLHPYRTFDSTISQDPSFWNAQLRNKATHQKILDLFIALIPPTYRNQVRFVSIMQPEKKALVFAAMGLQKKYSLEYFNLSVRPDLLTYLDSIPSFGPPAYFANTLGYPLAVYTMIHEFGHYVVDNSEQSYLKYFPDQDTYSVTPKTGSIIDSLLTRYWRPHLTSDVINVCYPKYGRMYFCFPANEFVSAYASTSPNEDAAESFAHFVLLADKPLSTTGANRKILLYYTYPNLVRLREAIRTNLKKMNILPRQPNFQLG